jgi:hypothetical protein
MEFIALAAQKTAGKAAKKLPRMVLASSPFRDPGKK